MGHAITSFIELGKKRLTVGDVVAVARGETELVFSQDVAIAKRFDAARAVVDDRIAQGTAIYGVTTGFGASCKTAVSANLSEALVLNLFRYHGCGQGPMLEDEESAAVLACWLAQLAGGYSGISRTTMEALVALSQRRVLPQIPSWGSVGASGDLTPLSYVAATLAGEREASFRGEVFSSTDALAHAGLAPTRLLPKESLSLMNGTSVMVALACLATARARSFMTAHGACTALVHAAVRGNPAHYDARIFEAKPHPGSVAYAARLRAHLELPANILARPGRIQDPYSLRCAPQEMGVLYEELERVEALLAIEINGASDNPLVCANTGDVLHGGNFYGRHVAFACDSLKGLVASAAELLERQVVLMNQTRTSGGLPENLVIVDDETRPAHHGMKAMEILASSLVADALKRTMPAASFSRSTEGANQDKVPMGSIAARDLRDIVELSETVLLVTLLVAAQAIDAGIGRAALSLPLREIYDSIRLVVPVLNADRRQDVDLNRLRDAYRAGKVVS